jgi:hypothetical protein
LNKQGFPAGTGDPSAFNTPDGALELYNTALAAFQYFAGDSLKETGSPLTSTRFGAFMDYIIQSGMLTDELQLGTIDIGNTGNNHGIFSFYEAVDTRDMVEGTTNPPDPLYTELQSLRGGANLAIGSLGQQPTLPSALTGHMHALIGYSEVLLADLYCSGIPLSTLDFGKDYTYHAGSPTADVYRDAIAHFDLAIAASADSARILNLARVGKARALLALGHPDSAALAVTAVPDGFVYEFATNWTTPFSAASNRFASSNFTVSNGEGINGLPYITNGQTDPRTATGVWAISQFIRYPLRAPLKYSKPFAGSGAVQWIGTIAPVIVADWIEVHLIRAEAALAAGDVTEWLSELNELRHTATSTDLGALTDPGDATSRVKLMFQERAYWLFMTGHRQGDLRRMIRQYHFTASQLYPTGLYPLGARRSKYGSDVTAPIPPGERNNPLFTGCLSRGA